MGCSTRLYGKNIIDIDRLKDIIEKEFDCEPFIRSIPYGNISGNWYKIKFTYKGKDGDEYRDLAFFPESTDSQTWGGYEPVPSPKHFVLTFGYWGGSVDILKRIADEVGGWLDVNDCDNELDIYIDGVRGKRRKLLTQILQ